MSQSGYTPILTYASGTPGNTPSAANLTSSSSGAELAINYADGKLFYKDSGGSVQVLAVKMPSSILPIANGGTNATATPTAGAVAYGTGTAYAFTAAGTSNQVLISNGASAPTWSSLSSIGVTTFSAGTTGFTPSSATSGAVTLAGTLATTNGGTGLTSFTANGVLYASSTSALTTGSALTFNAGNLIIGSSGNIKLQGGSASFDNPGNTQTWNIGAQNTLNAFYINNASSGTTAALMDSSNNWLVGTSNNYGVGATNWIMSKSGYVFAADNTGSASNRNWIIQPNSSAAGNLDFVYSSSNTGWPNAGYAMSLNSTGLGIGTSSPGSKLDVQATDGRSILRLTATTGTNPVYQRLSNTGGYLYVGMDGSAGVDFSAGAYAAAVWATGAYPMVFGTSGTERMRIDATGNVGIGTSSPSGRLDVDTTSNTYLNVNTTTTNSSSVQTFISGATSDGAAIGYNVALRFGTATGKNAAGFSEKARFDSSGNLGIGTSSPTNKLMVVSAFASAQGIQVSGNDPANAGIRLNNSTGSQNWDIIAGSVGVNNTYFTIRDATAAATRLTIDTSGNLGLGVTPSGWGTSALKAFQLGGGSFALSSSGAGAGDGSLTWNGYYNGTNWIYSYTGGASNRMRLNESGCAWFQAASGTAGNAITFTQAMTLDASGQLGVGVTSPKGKIDVQGAYQSSAPTTSSTPIARFNEGGALSWWFGANAYQYIWAQGIQDDGSNNLKNIALQPLGGSVGIGTGSPAGKLEVVSGNTSRWWLENDSSATNTKMVFANSGGSVNRARYQALEHYFQVSNVTDALILDQYGNLGLGVTPSAWSTVGAFQLKANAALFGYANSTYLAQNHVYDGSTSKYIFNGYALQYEQNKGNGVHAWYNAPFGTAGNAITFTQAMTLDASGNLVVGTTSATAKLSVADGSANTADSDSLAIISSYTTSTSRRGGICWNDYNNIVGRIATVFTGSSVDMTFGSLYANAYNSTERMRLTGTGNLGLGVTPSGWDSAFVAFEGGSSTAANGQGSLFFQKNGDFTTALGSNLYYNGGWKYKATNAAGRFEVTKNTFQWFQAASGTAGNAISFTQAMTLDASGNLGIGTTSPTGLLDVSSSSAAVTARVRSSWSNAYFGISRADGSSDALLRIQQGATNNWDIGTQAGVTALQFVSAGTERARIDSSGNLLVGTTGTLNTTQSGVYLGASSASYVGIGHASGTASGTNYEAYYYNAGYIGGITQNGTTAVAYNTSSDYRLKDNQQPLTGSGAFIDALKPKTWTWKADGSAGVGFIAHEVQEVSPSSVVGEKDGEQMQAMEYGSAEFIANIIAELQSLRKRVAQLEGK